MALRHAFRSSAVLAAALLTALVTWAGAPGAAAETRTVVDEKGPALQGPANQLLRGRLTYTSSRSVFVARLERLSVERTRVLGRIRYPDDSYLRILTKHRDGELVVRGHFYPAGDDTRTRVPVTARWDLARDRVKLVVDNAVGDPKPGNARAGLDLYTVTKGWLHGPLCGITGSGTVKKCNDDFVSARLSR